MSHLLMRQGSALYEIALSKGYTGDVVQDSDYSPQHILDPVSLEDTGSNCAALDLLDKKPYFFTGKRSRPPRTKLGVWAKDTNALKMTKWRTKVLTCSIVRWDEQLVEEFPGMRAGIPPIIAALVADWMDHIALKISPRLYEM
ncbi:hypothetical protein CEK25_011304 [Fusarium fujikuroi]|nr:hypothetical protein CEK25_011304 [Fusarium fujikuroi]